MKPHLALILLGVSVAAPLRAQAPAAVQYAPGTLEQLVAPIALYPDPLVALILPASTASTDIVLAARYLKQSGDPAQIDAQPWDASVKSLAHYSDLITWMDANLAWTEALGQAYAAQPAAVMQAIQTMRARALAAGTLVTTPQQQVVMNGNLIEILPVQPTVIYVPTYDWSVVYDTQPAWAYPVVSFSLCYPIGPWLAFDCDWHERRIRRDFDGWRHDWDHRRDGDEWRDHDGWRDRDGRRDGDAWRDRDGDRGRTSLAFSRDAAVHPGRPAPDRFARIPGRWPQSAPLARDQAFVDRPHGGTTAPPTVRTPPPTQPRRNEWGRAPGRDQVRVFPRPPAIDRAPAANVAQYHAPRDFAGRSEAPRPVFQPSPRPSYSAPAYAGSAPRNSAPAQRYAAPAPRNSAPTQHWSAPAAERRGGDSERRDGRAAR